MVKTGDKVVALTSDGRKVVGHVCDVEGRMARVGDGVYVYHVDVERTRKVA